MWKKYLSESADAPNRASYADIKFDDGSVMKGSEISNSSPHTPAREIQLIINSSVKTGLEKNVCIALSNVLACLNSASHFSDAEYAVADVKNVGCKYTIDRVRSFLRNSQTPEVEEHCWSLSNSCGELIDPSDKSRFVALTFKGREDLLTKEEFSLRSSYNDYLVYCLSLYDRSTLKSSEGHTELIESYTSYIRKYLSNTDLCYTNRFDNALITGILYDFCKEYNVNLSSYVRNVENFRVFLSKYLPVIDELFEYSRSGPPDDYRLLFPVKSTELLLKVPLLNLIDSTVVLNSVLRFNEAFVEDEGFDSLKTYLEAVMEKSNPGLDVGQLWAAFYCYYACFRTAKERVEKRPDSYVTPREIGGYEVNFSQVEKEFDRLQKERPNMNVRRRFNGYLAQGSFALFKKFGLGFRKITRLEVPERYSYLNVDYYKHINAHILSDEEKLLICNIHADVNNMCNDRMIAAHATDGDKDRVTRRETPRYKQNVSSLYQLGKKMHRF